MTPDDVMKAFRDCGALLDGHFVLRSGLHSRQFFQCALLLQHPTLAAQMCSALVDQVDASGFTSVVSPAMGGILVGHEMGRQLNKRHIFAEKQDGKLVIRRFNIEPGERFLVAEDVVTTGSAVLETCRLVREAGGVVAAVAVIVDRSGGNPPDFGAPFHSLLSMKVETFAPDNLPDDLKGSEAIKPGSK